MNNKIRDVRRMFGMTNAIRKFVHNEAHSKY